MADDRKAQLALAYARIGSEVDWRATPSSSELAVHRAGDVAIVTVSGECDVALVEDLHEALVRGIEEGPGGLILDLSKTELIDSAALGAIALTWKLMRQLGRPLAVVATDPAVRRPFGIAGLDRVLELSDSLGKAFAALRRKREMPARF